MRTRPNVPRTGRRKKFRLLKARHGKRYPRAKRPNQIAATIGRRRTRRIHGR